MREKLSPWQKAGLSPTRRSLAVLCEEGYTAAITEHWNSFAHIRQDLFGFIDLLAVHPVGELRAIQTCSGVDHMKRVAKVRENPVAKLLAPHMEIEVWSWAKRGARGKPKLWTLRKQSLTTELLPKKSLLRRKREQGTWEVA